MLSFKRSRQALLPAFLLCCCYLPAQSIIHVPADQPTIQAGIDAAHNGDTVLVAAGTYYENIDFKGKAITVTSSDGPSKTTIDGGKNTAVVTFKSHEPRTAVISNFTITHGTSSSQIGFGDAGGVEISNSAPTILNNVITQNYCQGVASNGSAPLIQGNVISSSLTPENCFVLLTGGIRVAGNLNGSYPAASDGTSALIIGNTIENNTTGQSGDGGGDGGAGIAIWGGSPTIQGNIIRNNLTRSGSGAAINVVYGDSISIVDNLIYGNTAGCGGGAIGSEPGGLNSNTYLLIANNTMVNNTGGNGGGYSDCRKTSELWVAFYDGGGPTIKLVNNIIRANISPAMDCGDLNNPADEAHQSLFDHNLLYDSAGPFMASTCFDSTHLHGNIVADPQFTNLAKNDFHLQLGSPAIDAGNGSVLAMLKSLSNIDLAKDFDGNTREQDTTGKGQPIIDMGAFEYTGLVNATPTRIVLSSSLYTGPAGTSATLTATLSSVLGVPTGTVNFYLDEQAIGSSTISGAGVATLPNVLYKPGVHVLYATYDGQGSFPSAKSVIIVVNINKYTTVITLTGSPNPALVGQSVTFNVHVSSSDPGYIPTPIQLADSYGSVPLNTLTPDGSGNASFSTSTLALGIHSVTARYAGDAQHADGSAFTYEQIVNGYPTTVLVSSSLNPSKLNQPVTFSVKVTSANGTPTGTVELRDGTNVLGSGTLNGTGLATFTISTLTVGQHSITATYAPTGPYQGNTGTITQQVKGYSVNATLGVNPTSIQAGDSATLTATITPVASGNGVPTGTVTFLRGGITLGTGTLNASGVASITTSNFDAGTNSLTCTYSGDSTFSPANCNVASIQVQAAETTLTLVSNANPTPALTPASFTATLASHGQPVAGAVRFYVDGVLQAGGTQGATGTTIIALKFSPGAHTVRAEFAGSSTLNASFSQITETALQNATETYLTGPAGPVYENQQIGLTATVHALTGTAQPYGSMTLMEGGVVVATQTIAQSQNSPSVVFNAGPLALGTHALTAVYTPADNNFGASTSAPIALTVLPQTFLFESNASSITIQTEHHASMMLKLTSVGGWTGDVQMGCEAPVPPVLTCTVEPHTTLAANGTVQVKLTLETDAIAGFKSGVDRMAAPRMLGGKEIVSLAGLLIPLACFGMRRRRYRWEKLVLLVVCIGAVAGLNGCSSLYPAHTPPGAYTVTLKAQGATRGAVVPTVRTLQIKLDVTP